MPGRVGFGGPGRAGRAGVLVEDWGGGLISQLPCGSGSAVGILIAVDWTLTVLRNFYGAVGVRATVFCLVLI